MGASTSPFARPRRRGVLLPYVIIALTVLIGFCSLAVDYGRAQLVKTQLRRCADAAAHDYLVLYLTSGSTTYADANGPQYSSANTPVSNGSGAPPTLGTQWGYWDAAHKAFSASPNGGPVAMRVTASCSAARGNGVYLPFAAVLGRSTLDVNVTAVAAVTGGGQSGAISVSANSNPYLAGMPDGSTTVWGDTTTTQGATQVSSIPVKPGSYLTFGNVTGTTTVLPGYMPYSSADGTQSGSGTAIHHGQNWDGTMLSANTDNGIADAVIPESTLVGLFLDDSAPNSTSPPATVDWTQPAVRDQASYNSIQLKQPFPIGSGKTSGGVVQKFLVPPGATRFYVAIWDGVAYFNNAGSLSGTVAVASSVQLVQ